MGYKVFVSFEGEFIVHRWGFSDEVVGGFLDTPRFEDIPLGPAKLPSPRFLGFVTSGLSNLQRGISFVFQGSCHLHCLKILKLIPFFYFFFFKPVEWREVKKRLLPVRLGERGGSLRKSLL